MSNEELEDAERGTLIQEYAQGLLDILVREETLEHIPIVKTLVAAIKAVGSVRDAILVQKIKVFIEALAEVPVAQRVAMVGRLEADPGYNRKVGLHLIELLDRIDSHRKPTMISHVFAAYALERIDLTALQRLLAAIDKLPSHEIDTVRRVGNAVTNNRQELRNVDPESTYAIINAGLANISTGFGGGGLEITRTCSLFLELNLDEKSAK